MPDTPENDRPDSCDNIIRRLLNAPGTANYQELLSLTIRLHTRISDLEEREAERERVREAALAG